MICVGDVVKHESTNLCVIGQVVVIYEWQGVVKAVVESYRGGPPAVLPITSFEHLSTPPTVKEITFSKGGKY